MKQWDVPSKHDLDFWRNEVAMLYNEIEVKGFCCSKGKMRKIKLPYPESGQIEDIELQEETLLDIWANKMLNSPFISDKTKNIYREKKVITIKM